MAYEKDIYDSTSRDARKSRFTSKPSRTSDVEILKINSKVARKELDSFFGYAKDRAREFNREVGNMTGMQGLASAFQSLTKEATKFYQAERAMAADSNKRYVEDSNRRIAILQQEMQARRNLYDSDAAYVAGSRRSFQTPVAMKFDSNAKEVVDSARAQMSEINNLDPMGINLEAKKLDLGSLGTLGITLGLDKFVSEFSDVVSNLGNIAEDLKGSMKNPVSGDADLLKEIKSLKDGVKTLTRKVSGDKTSPFSRDPDEKEGKSLLKTIKSGFTNIIKDIADIVYREFRSGIVDYQSAYESTFSDIAARTRSDNMDTREMYGAVIDQASDMNFKNNINYAKELVPALAESVKQGFTGLEATNKAVADSSAKIILPWLDTATEAWVNMSFNMSKDNMNMLKSQQLQLQTSTAGNRLLQNGIINNLNTAIEPILRNIDFNTGGAANLGLEAQAMMASYVNQGFTPNEAYSMVQDVVSVMKNPYEAVTSGDVSKVIMGSAFAEGGDFSDVVNSTNRILEMMGSSNNPYAAGAIASGTGMRLASGVYSGESARTELQARQGMEQYMPSSKDLSGIYAAAEVGIDNLQTPSAQLANELSNFGTTLVGEWITAIPGHEKWFATVEKAVVGILSYLLADTAWKGLKELVGKNLIKSASAETLGKAASSGADVLKTGGLSAVKSMLPQILKYSGVAAGAAIAGIGTYKAIKDFSNVADKGSIKEEKVSSAASGSMNALGAGAGAVGAGLLLASNPIGWAVIAAGGVALAGAEIVKSFTRSSGVVSEINTLYEQQAGLLKQDQEARKNSLSEIAKSITDVSSIDDKRKAVVEAGILSQEAANKMTGVSIDSFVANLQKATDALSKTEENILKEFEKNSKETEEARRKANKNILELAIINEQDTNKQTEMLKQLGYSDEQIGKIGKGKGLFGLGGTYSAKDLLSERTDNKGILGIGGQSKLDAAKSGTLNEFAQIYGLEGYQEIVIDPELSKQIAQAYSFLKTYKDSELLSSPSIKDSYDKNKEFLSGEEILPRLKELTKLTDPLKGYATGYPYVYRDSVVKVHEGEGILNKQENKEYITKSIVGPYLSRLFGGLFDRTPATREKSEDSNDSTRSEIVKAISEATTAIVKAVSSSNRDTSSVINKMAGTLPRPSISYDRNLVSLRPSITE